MAYIVVAYIVTANIVMAYIVMAGGPSVCHSVCHFAHLSAYLSMHSPFCPYTRPYTCYPSVNTCVCPWVCVLERPAACVRACLGLRLHAQPYPPTRPPVHLSALVRPPVQLSIHLPTAKNTNLVHSPSGKCFPTLRFFASSCASLL